MKRTLTKERPNWREKIEAIGFNYHTFDETYWDESAYYSFLIDEIEVIENATAELWRLYLEAIEYVISENKFDLFHIPAYLQEHIKNSWENDDPSIYGRFDLRYDGKSAPKLLEFNADTPTSLFESGVVQWYWLQELYPQKDQFNSIHEKLVAYWHYLKPYISSKKIHFASVDTSMEDYTNTIYLLDTAKQAGFDTEWINIEQIGWNGTQFTDLTESEIQTVFKLYPWEWLASEDFGQHIVQATTQWIEPSWKMIASSKALLPILWKLFPHHQYLLQAYVEPNKLIDYAKKPIYSREGANITLFENGKVVGSSKGEYGSEGYIYQKLSKLPNFDGNYPVIGSWIIGQEPAGIGIRETNSLITDNLSRFVPHIIA